MRRDESRRAQRLLRLLLLCALALSVVGMHHMATAPDRTPQHSVAAATTAPAHVDSSSAAMTATAAGMGMGMGMGMGHDLLHLCLAVLWAAAGLLLLAWLLAAVGAGAPMTGIHRWARHTGRPLETPGRLLLTSLCVLRT